MSARGRALRAAPSRAATAAMLAKLTTLATLLVGTVAAPAPAASGAGAAEAGAARRVVSLAPSITETVFALGRGDRLVGVTTFCDWPPPARKIPRIGSYVAPNVEAILAARPDVVLAVPAPGNRAAVETLERLGLEVVVVSEGPRVEDVLDSIRRIGRSVGARAEGEALATELAGKVATVAARVAPEPPRTTLVVVGRHPLVVAGGGTLLDELVRLAGGRNLARDLAAWPRLGPEALVRLDPEVLFDTSMGDEAAEPPRLYRTLGLRAAEAGRIHAVRLDEILRPGPRLAEGLRWLAVRLHPGAFGE